MKTQFSAFAISAIILSAVASTDPVNLPATKEASKVEQAQSTDFAFFRTHRQGKGIVATWGVTSNTGIARFSVKKTNEDPSDPYAYWKKFPAPPAMDQGRTNARTKMCFPVLVITGLWQRWSMELQSNQEYGLFTLLNIDQSNS